VQFSPELREGVERGRITLTYRLWSRPQVKEGGRYAVAGATIEVDAMELVPFSSVTKTDLRRTGERDLEALRRRTAHAGPVHDNTLVFRIEFHVIDEN
jgi:ASCH domain